jgi:hypothetical protein
MASRIAAAGGLYPVRVGVWWIMTQMVDPAPATTWCEHALVLWAMFAAQWFALLVVLLVVLYGRLHRRPPATLG